MDTRPPSSPRTRRGFHPQPVRKRGAGGERDPALRNGNRDKEAALASHGEDAAAQPEFGPPRDERAG